MRKISLLIFLFFTGLLNSQIANRPVPQRLYNNLSKEFPDFLNSEQAAQLEEKLEQFSNQTSNQICVVIVDDFNGLDAADYATRIVNEWGIGQKEANNGIVILVKPTGNDGGRDLFIAVGYGLEGAIPDLATKRIRENEMNPYLKKGDYFTALDKGTEKLMQLAKGEINVKDYVRQHKKGNKLSTILIILILVFLIRAFFGGGGGNTYSGRGYRTYWGGGFGGGFGGGSSFGGGGGFGGFGGGSSGGGGSGGKW